MPLENSFRPPTSGWLADVASEEEDRWSKPSQPTKGWLADVADEELSRRSRLRSLAEEFIRGNLERPQYPGILATDPGAGVDWRNVPNVPEGERAEFLQILDEVRATEPAPQRSFPRQIAESFGTGASRVGTAVVGGLAEVGVPGLDKGYERFARAVQSAGWAGRSRDVQDMPWLSPSGFGTKAATGFVEMVPGMAAGGAVGKAVGLGAAALGAGTAASATAGKAAGVAFWANQEGLPIADDLRANGASDEMANGIGMAVGPLIGYIEYLQVGHVIPKAFARKLREGAVKSVGQWAKQGLKTYGQENLEEAAQDATGMAAQWVGQQLDENVDVDWRAQWDSFVEGRKQTAASMLPLTGAGAAAGGMAARREGAERRAALGEARAEIDPNAPIVPPETIQELEARAEQAAESARRKAAAKAAADMSVGAGFFDEEASDATSTTEGRGERSADDGMGAGAGRAEPGGAVEDTGNAGTADERGGVAEQLPGVALAAGYDADKYIAELGDAWFGLRDRVLSKMRRRNHSEDDAEEVSSRIATNATQAIRDGKYDPAKAKSGVAGWLAGMVDNEIAEFESGQARQPGQLDVDVEGGTQPDVQAEGAEALDMATYEAMTDEQVREAARGMGVNINRARTRAARLKAIAKKLEQVGATDERGADGGADAAGAGVDRTGEPGGVDAAGPVSGEQAAQEAEQGAAVQQAAGPAGDGVVAAKQPWEMTRAEHALQTLGSKSKPGKFVYQDDATSESPVRAVLDKGHRIAVEQAIAAGKPVPAAVLAEYPELRPASVAAEPDPRFFVRRSDGSLEPSEELRAAVSRYQTGGTTRPALASKTLGDYQTIFSDGVSLEDRQAAAARFVEAWKMKQRPSSGVGPSADVAGGAGGRGVADTMSAGGKTDGQRAVGPGEAGAATEVAAGGADDGGVGAVRPGGVAAPGVAAGGAEEADAGDRGESGPRRIETYPKGEWHGERERLTARVKAAEAAGAVPYVEVREDMGQGRSKYVAYHAETGEKLSESPRIAGPQSNPSKFSRRKGRYERVVPFNPNIPAGQAYSREFLDSEIDAYDAQTHESMVRKAVAVGDVDVPADVLSSFGITGKPPASGSTGSMPGGQAVTPETQPAGVAGPVTPPVPSNVESVTEQSHDTMSGDSVSKHFSKQLSEGKSYKSINEARQEAAAIIGKPVEPGTPEAKDVDEAMERGVVTVARKIAQEAADDVAAFDGLLDLYRRQPNLGTRSSTQLLNQAFSTPAPLAWITNVLADVQPDDTVYDSSAGNGMLLIGAGAAMANELDPKRTEALRQQGFTTTNEDATEYRPDKPVDKVIINPPFGSVTDDAGAVKKWNINGVKTDQVDHAIVLNTLPAMKDDGRAVLIVGSKGFEAGKPKSDLQRASAYVNRRPFYDALYDEYNVVDHFTVAGDLYQKQGAKFPVDVIVIDGRGVSKRPKPYNFKGGGLPAVFTTWEELKDAKLQRTAVDAGGGVSDRGSEAGTNEPDVGRVPEPTQGTGAPSGGTNEQPAGDAGGELAGPVREMPVDGDSGEGGGQRGVPERAEGPTRDQAGGLPDAGVGAGLEGGGVSRPGQVDEGADSTAGGLDQAELDAAMTAALDAEFAAATKPATEPAEPVAEPPRKRRPTASKRAKAEGPAAPEPRADRTKAALDDALLEFKDVFGTEFDAGLSPQKLAATVKLTRAAIDHGISKFAEYVKFIAKQIGAGNARKISEYLESAWRNLGKRPEFSHIDAAGRVEDVLKPAAQDKETAFQVEYKPASASGGLGTLVPKTQALAAQRSLQRVRDRYGDVDKFVAGELGYKDLSPYFSAEQVDALALMIANHKDGKAFVLGDQTGVGKGRVAAAAMVYAKRNNLVPVFVTNDPGLYADMIRDLTDIGQNTADKPFMPLATNTMGGDKTVQLPDGRVLKQSPRAAQDRLRAAVHSISAGGKLTARVGGQDVEHDAVFTTYKQLQPIGQEYTWRNNLLLELAPNAFFILDESHNAGGQKGRDNNPDDDDPPLSAAGFMREALPTARGQLFLSATYAKRPDVMDLYVGTGMADAVDKPEDLPGAIATGGVPLQQVVSEMLTESGGYLRRERSYDGVEFAPKVVDVDMKAADDLSSIYRLINRFDQLKEGAVMAVDEDIVSAGGELGDDISTGYAGVESTSFTSILWNMTDQMLLGLKADAAANEAVEAWRNGETPVLVVDNTMESALDSYLVNNPASHGEAIAFTFRDLLMHYLERSREVLVKHDAKDPNSNEQISLTDEQLSETEGALEAYNAAKDAIEAFSADVPVSPIDRMRKVMEAAGMRVAEITGRKRMIEYRYGQSVLIDRPADETGSKGKGATVDAINNGDLDAVILNRSGAVGLSLHASERVRNQRKRRMIIAQAAKNIDEFMQALGRVHRTGQVVKPAFTLLMSNAPAETRPASVLVQKLASLNANVTASAAGSVSFDAPDILNAVGNRIVAEYVAERPDLNEALGNPVGINQSGTAVVQTNTAKKVSGRMVLMPVEEQREFWDTVVEAFNEEIAELDRMGKNPLEAKAIPLEARTIESTEIFEGDVDSDSPFMQPAQLERARVRKVGDPMKPEEVKKKIRDFYGEDFSQDVARQWRLDQKARVEGLIRAEYEKRQASMKDDVARLALASRLDQLRETIVGACGRFAPGAVVEVVEYGDATTAIDGIVTRLEAKTAAKATKPSGWVLEIALASSDRVMRVPVSRLVDRGDADNPTITFVEPTYRYASDEDYERFNQPAAAHEERYLATGNILAAFSQLVDEHGSIVFFTDESGESRRGVLLPRRFNADKWLSKRPVVFQNTAHVMAFIEQGGATASPDFAIQVSMDENGNLTLRSPRSRQRSGQYTANRKLLSAMGRDFVSRGAIMIATVPKANAVKTVDAILEIGSLQTGMQKDLANSLAPKSPDAPAEKPSRAAQAREEFHEAVSDFMSHSRRLGQNPMLDPVLYAKALKIVAKAIEVGIREFAEFLSGIEANAGKTVPKAKKAVLEKAFHEAWAEHDAASPAAESPKAPETATASTEPRPAPDTMSGAPEAPEAAGGQPGAPGAPGDITSIKNAIVAELRALHGLGARNKPVAEDFPLWLDAAATKIANDPTWPERLVAEFALDPTRVHTKIESAAFSIYLRKLENDITTNRAAEADATRDGNANAIQSAQTIVADKLKRLDELVGVTEGSGTEIARAFVSRKIALARDFSEAGIRMRVLKGQDGAPLSKEQEDWIAKNAATMKELEDVSDKANRLAEELAEQQRVNKALNEQVAEAIRAADEKKAGEKKEEKKGPQTKQPQKKKPGPTWKEQAQKHVADAWDDVLAVFRRSKSKGMAGLDPELVISAGKLVAAYVELGVASLSEFMTHVTAKMGTLSAYEDAAFRQAWDDLQATGEIDPIEVADPADLAEQSRIARRLLRAMAEAGERDRERLVSLVHTEMDRLYPGYTRRQTQGAIAGEGLYRPPTEDALELLIRDTVGQIQQQVNIERLKAGQPAVRYGQGRPPMSDEQRRLVQQKNDLLRKNRLLDANPERYAKTARQAAKTALRHWIADRRYEMEQGEKIVRQRNTTEPDEQMRKLQAERDEVKSLWDAAFPKEPLSDEKRAELVETALDRAIAIMEADLAAGKLEPKKLGRAPATNPGVEAKRAKLDQLKRHRDELRANSPEYQSTLEAKKDAAYDRILAQRLAGLRQRVADRDFAPRETKQTKRELTNAQLDALFHITEHKRHILNQEDKWKRAHRTTTQKIMQAPLEIQQNIRALWTTGELSSFLRQGLFGVLMRPGTSAKSWKPALEAWDAKQAFEQSEAMRNDPLYQFAVNAKLPITDSLEGAYFSQEEAFQGGELASKLPGVKQFSRIYVAQLNKQRFDLFKLYWNMRRAAGGIDETTPEGRKAMMVQAKTLANWVSIVTGRGVVKEEWANAVSGLSLFLFAPRFVLSRLQFLVGAPVWSMGGDMKTRKLIAQEYGRFAVSTATLYALAHLAAAAFWDDDDDDKPTVEYDPRSSDFMKIKVGNMRIDPLGGLLQTTVLAARLGAGEVKRSSGEIVPLRDSGTWTSLTGGKQREVPFGGKRADDTAFSFLRSKLAPAWSIGLDVLSGESMVGESLHPMEWVLPITWREVYESITEDGWKPVDATDKEGMTRYLAAVAAVLGVNMDVYNTFGSVPAVRQHTERLWDLQGQTESEESGADIIEKMTLNKWYRGEFIPLSRQAKTATESDQARMQDELKASTAKIAAYRKEAIADLRKIMVRDLPKYEGDRETWQQKREEWRAARAKAKKALSSLGGDRPVAIGQPG